jgi:hypothetical protein
MTVMPTILLDVPRLHVSCATANQCDLAFARRFLRLQIGPGLEFVTADRTESRG